MLGCVAGFTCSAANGAWACTQGSAGSAGGSSSAGGASATGGSTATSDAGTGGANNAPSPDASTDAG